MILTKDPQKLHRVIQGLTELHPDKQLLIVDADGIKQGKDLHSLGIYCCETCGYLQPIDLKYCKKCCTERFILTKEYEPIKEDIPFKI